MQRTNFLFLLCWLSLSFVGFGQTETNNRTQSPYNAEYNPWFKFTKFKRGFDSDSLKTILDQLEDKSRKIWTREDSLNFARTTLQTGNNRLSAYYFSHLNVDYKTENDYWWAEMILYILQKDYDQGIERIHQTSPGILEFSKIYFLDKFLIAYKAESKTPKWYKTNSVLKWKVDSSLYKINKNSDAFNRKVIAPLENLDFVLKQLVHYIHSDDPILASACREMGEILEYHVSLSQAYIAYSLGRHYNKWDKLILTRSKEVKVKLTEKRYKIPIFRRYFPRIEHWRFEYEVLKEKALLQQNDTLSKLPPKLMQEKTTKEFLFPHELLILGGIALLILLVAIFIKTKK